jgi:hypothetical protein
MTDWRVIEKVLTILTVRNLGAMRMSCIIPSLGRAKILCDTIGKTPMPSHRQDDVIIVHQIQAHDKPPRHGLAE